MYARGDTLIVEMRFNPNMEEVQDMAQGLTELLGDMEYNAGCLVITDGDERVIFERRDP